MGGLISDMAENGDSNDTIVAVSASRVCKPVKPSGVQIDYKGVLEPDFLHKNLPFCRNKQVSYCTCYAYH